jgi:hypothetical protein
MPPPASNATIATSSVGHTAERRGWPDAPPRVTFPSVMTIVLIVCSAGVKRNHPSGVIARHPRRIEHVGGAVSGGDDPTSSGTDVSGVTAAGAPRGRSPGRVWGIRVLLTLATLLTIVGVLAVWANRQVLSAGNWSNTSTALLENTAIRTQIADYLVDQLYANVNVAGELQSALPPRLQPLAGPVAGGLRNLAEKAAFDLLGRPRIQAAWKSANRLTAKEFIDIVEGNSRLVSLNGNAVFVDLRPIAVDLASQLGLPSSVVQSIPPGAGRLKVISSNQITAVQNAVELVKGLAIILPAVALIFLALAVYLAEGRRRRVLLFAGIDLLIAGLVVIIARNVAGNQIVNSLATTDSAKPAVQAAWSIGTSMLSDIAQATIIIGLAVILAAWLAGPTRPAVAFRRAAAPWFRERPGTTYAVILVLLLLIVLWGPIPATRMPIPVLIMIVLVCLGTEALRTQTKEEFPRAEIGDTFAGVRARVGRARSSGRRRPTSPPSPPIAGGSESPWSSAEEDRLSRLERLAALRVAGALTEQEFAAEKAVLLARPDTDL